MSATTIDPTQVDARDDDLPIPAHLRSAWSVLFEGLRLSPELRKGLGFTIAISLGAVIGNLAAAGSARRSCSVCAPSRSASSRWRSSRREQRLAGWSAPPRKR